MELLWVLRAGPTPGRAGSARPLAVSLVHGRACLGARVKGSARWPCAGGYPVDSVLRRDARLDVPCASLFRIVMQVPFTHDQFLNLFAAYNTALWPVAILLWLATLAGIVQLVRGRARGPGLAALLTLHWAWSGVAYHAL